MSFKAISIVVLVAILVHGVFRNILIHMNLTLGAVVQMSF